MWNCHKCGKPVYFAERKQSLGYDWHPECLRCEECGKRLDPGLHAEHKGVPYCNVPCYGALFGPQLFGHGTRVESHKSFGVKGSPRPSGSPALPRDHLESKLKVYNQFFNNRSHEIRSREVNDRLVLEGALRVYWGVQGMIHLKEDDDQRTVITVRKRNSCRYVSSSEVDSENSPFLYDKENADGNDTGIDISTSSLMDGDATDISLTESISYDSVSVSSDLPSPGSSSSSKEVSPDHKSLTLPSKLDVKQLEWDDIDDLLQVKQFDENAQARYQTMPSPLPSQSSLDQETESSKTVTLDFQSFSNSTQPSTTPANSSDEFVTPCNSLKNADFDEFKKQIHKEYMANSYELQNVSADTLKHNQPIDPSRINDSLKFYGDNVMSKSYGGEQNLRVYPSNQSMSSIDPLKINDTFNLNHRGDSSQSSHQLRKCGSASSWIVHSESENGKMPLINRSKSGPDWCENSYLDSEDNSETLKPATMRKNRLNIRMDCYGDLNVKSPNSEVNGSSTIDTSSMNSDDNIYNDNSEDGVVLRKPKTGSTAIKRRSGNKRSRTKLKRRCSINGHYYNRETSFFTPPYGSQMSVWVTSLVSTQDVINLLLEKYKVESNPKNFALFIVRDNGEQRRLKDDDFPLIQRIMLGPHEDVARLFLTDSQVTTEISCEVAQFLNLSELECKSILDRYDDELNREVLKVKDKYTELRRRIVQRMESLKVRL